TIVLITVNLFAQNNKGETGESKNSIHYIDYMGASLIGTFIGFYPLNKSTEYVMHNMLKYDYNEGGILDFNYVQWRLGIPIMIGSIIGVTFKSKNKSKLISYIVPLNLVMFSASFALIYFSIIYDLTVPFINAAVAYKVDKKFTKQIKIKNKKISLFPVFYKSRKFSMVGLNVLF
ncbi:MAG: hypothetical protein KAR38_02235, partial [Calditrichia bacterium]|nr:hypothetical protein [Calditrichia bacterium]